MNVCNTLRLMESTTQMLLLQPHHSRSLPTKVMHLMAPVLIPSLSWRTRGSAQSLASALYAGSSHLITQASLSTSASPTLLGKDGETLLRMKIIRLPLANDAKTLLTCTTRHKIPVNRFISICTKCSYPSFYHLSSQL